MQSPTMRCFGLKEVTLICVYLFCSIDTDGRIKRSSNTCDVKLRKLSDIMSRRYKYLDDALYLEKIERRELVVEMQAEIKRLQNELIALRQTIMKGNTRESRAMDIEYWKRSVRNLKSGLESEKRKYQKIEQYVISMKSENVAKEERLAKFVHEARKFSNKSTGGGIVTALMGELLLRLKDVEENVTENTRQFEKFRTCVDKNSRILNDTRTTCCRLMNKVVRQNNETHVNVTEMSSLEKTTEYGDLATREPMTLNHESKALISASRRGDTPEVARLLLRGNSNINAKNYNGQTALTIASAKGYMDIIKMLLLQPELDVNSVDNSGTTALMHACLQRRTFVVHLLLRNQQININTKNNVGNTAVLITCFVGHATILELLLLRKNVSINLVNNDGWSTLMVACYKNHRNVVKMLLDRTDVDINIADSNGLTALIIACHIGNKNIVNMLLAFDNIAVNAKQNNGMNALIVASIEGHAEVLKLLLKKDGIDVNRADKHGWTTLMYGVERGHVTVIELLLADGRTHRHATNDEGQNAFQLAQKSGKTYIQSLLQST